MADLKGKIKEITTNFKEQLNTYDIFGCGGTRTAKSAALNKNPRRVECFRCACFAVLTAI